MKCIVLKCFNPLTPNAEIILICYQKLLLKVTFLGLKYDICAVQIIIIIITDELALLRKYVEH